MARHSETPPIDERQRVADELRASEAKFSGILAIAADAIVTIDESHCIMHFNRGAEEIFGWEAAEVIGRPLNVLLPERFRGGHDRLIEEFARGSDVARRMGHRRAVSALRRDGSEFPAEASISKLDLPDGRRIYTALLRDITERKLAEESERFLAEAGAQLARSLEFEPALDAIAHIAIPVLADGALLDVVEDGGVIRRLASANATARINGTALAALAERHPLTWDSPSPVIDVLRRGTGERIAPVDDEWLEAHEENGDAIARWHASGARAMLVLPLSVGGRALGALSLVSADAEAFGRDARELAEKFVARASLALENARLYRAAQRASRARDEVLGVVSHDLRNPLSAIAMCARVLRESPPTDDTERETLLATIARSAEWMDRLIRDLLDAVSIEAGRLSLDLREEEVGPIIEGALTLFAVEAADRGISIVREIAPSLPEVRADAERVVQVLGNLLRNALKFTPDGGRVTVRAEHRGDDVQITVADTGIGMSREVQTRVFERYWSAGGGQLGVRGTASDAGGRPRGSGAGLGLAIARSIIDAHGGRIWVESTPGEGSTFTFVIPVASPGSLSSAGR